VASRTSQPALSGRTDAVRRAGARRRGGGVRLAWAGSGTWTYWEAEGSLKKVVVAVALLASLCVVAVAQGVVVQEFSYQIKDIRSDGRFTVVFNSRSYDPSGGIPDELNELYQRLPRGATVPRAFRKSKYYCQAKKLVDKVRLEKGSGRFTPYLEKLLKGKKKPPRSAKDNVAVCRFARIGKGRVTVDARPFEDRPIPADLQLFWTKPARGAVAAFSIIGIPDERYPVVRDNPTVRETVPTLNANFYNEPTSDGLYGYKLVLPSGPVNGIRVSVAEVTVEVVGLTLTKTTRKCVKRKRGKCVKRKTTKKNTFWFTEPPCPPSGTLSFQSFFGYKEPAVQDQTKTVTIPCPEFDR
jgi:hypothetical protein